MLGGVVLLMGARAALTHRRILPPRPAMPVIDRNLTAWRWVCGALMIAGALSIGSVGVAAVPLLLMAGGVYLVGVGFLGGGKWRLIGGHLLGLAGLFIFMGYLPNELVTYGLAGGAGLVLSGGMSLIDLRREQRNLAG